MKVTKQDLEKAQIELLVELSAEEFASYIDKGAEETSRNIKIEGFRPGKVPYDILKQKVGEMTILEEAAHIAIQKTIDEAVKNNITEQIVGAPKVDIIKLAPGNPFEYKAAFAVLPAITLGAYKNLGIKQKKTDIQDGDVLKMLNDLRELRAQEIIVDREIKDGDKAVVDVQIFVNNVPVDGGQSRDVAVILGKDYFIPGFDKNILGAKKGAERVFGLPYPADYHMKNLAGQMAEFKVKIKEVYERLLPALDDNLAANFGLKKLDELKNNIKQSLAEQKKRGVEQVAEREMLEKIAAKTKFGQLPEMLVEHETKTMLAELEQAIVSQGGNFADYLQSLKKTADQLTLDLLPEAVKRVQVSLLVREVANAEKISVPEAEVDEQIKHMKKHYQDKPEILSRLGAAEYKNYVWNALASRKVVDKLRDWNIDKD